MVIVNIDQEKYLYKCRLKRNNAKKKLINLSKNKNMVDNIHLIIFENTLPSEFCKIGSRGKVLNIIDNLEHTNNHIQVIGYGTDIKQIVPIVPLTKYTIKLIKEAIKCNYNFYNDTNITKLLAAIKNNSFYDNFDFSYLKNYKKKYVHHLIN